MSDASSRTLLSLWGIKEAEGGNSSSDLTSENNSQAPHKSAFRSGSDSEAASPARRVGSVETKPVDRAKSASQWSCIFSKPRKNLSQEGQQPNANCVATNSVDEDENPDCETTKSVDEDEKPSVKRMHRPMDPRNPFEPSFVHVLRASSQNLAKVENLEQPKNEKDECTVVNADAKLLEKPSYMHVFRTTPEKLRVIKPRVHSFFAKRSTSSASGVQKLAPKGNSLRSIRIKHAPWATVHVRPALVYDGNYAVPLPKRPVTCAQQGFNETSDSEWKLVVSQLPKLLPATRILPHIPKRALYAPEQLRALAALSQSKRNGNFLSDLITAAGEPKPFDCGEFEGTMWYEKYAPDTPSRHLLSTETQKVADWANSQMQKRQKQRQWPPKRKRRNVDDFVVDDDDDDADYDDILVVCGPCGSGKTSAVYAAAKSLNAFVFEVNCGTKRTGKELSSLLDGISHNHAVHNAKSCVILIDDADIVYENEAGGFWTTIARFTATSRRPVIVTCTDPGRLALPDLGTSLIRLQMPDLVRVTDIAWTVALSEGYVLDKTDVAALAVVTRGDMRRILAHLQFWCQMGVGGLPSGIDWYAKDFEFANSFARRVVSEDSWCPPLIDTSESELFEIIPPHPREPQADRLDSYASAAEDLSEIDSAFEPFVVEQRAAPEETVSGNGSTILSQWRVSTISRPAVHSYLNGNTSSYLSAIRDVFADEYAFGTSRDSIIAIDIAPYMREMAACDYRRALIMEQSLAHHQSARGMRMTRRMWAASGIDSRQYMGYSVSSLRLILSTCLPAQLFESGS